jgi:hypothetical protein
MYVLLTASIQELECFVKINYHHLNVISVILSTVGGRPNWVYWSGKLKSSRSRYPAPTETLGCINHLRVGFGLKGQTDPKSDPKSLFLWDTRHMLPLLYRQSFWNRWRWNSHNSIQLILHNILYCLWDRAMTSLEPDRVRDKTLIWPKATTVEREGECMTTAPRPQHWTWYDRS